MAVTGQEASVELDIDKLSIRDGFAVFHIVKIWGTLELKHRGSTMMGGMTWVPDGALPVGIPVSDDILNTDQLATAFSDLMGTLMPSIKVLVKHVDNKDVGGDTVKEDF